MFQVNSFTFMPLMFQHGISLLLGLWTLLKLVAAARFKCCLETEQIMVDKNL